MACVGPHHHKKIYFSYSAHTIYSNVPECRGTTQHVSQYIDFYSKRNFSFQQENEKIHVSSASVPKKIPPPVHACAL